MRRLISGIALGLLALLLIALVIAPEFEVSFTEEEIKRRVAAEIPHAISTGGVKILVRAATVDLRANNKIAIDADVQATGFTLDGEGSASINSSVTYDRGRFYFGELRHGDLAFSFSESSNETIADVTNTLKGLLEREGEEARSTGNANKSERIEELQDYTRRQLKADAIGVLDKFLQSIPIYDMSGQGTAMWLAALSIKSVAISDNQITTILSLQQLILRLIVGALTILLIVASLAPSVTLGVTRWLFSRWARRKQK